MGEETGWCFILDCSAKNCADLCLLTKFHQALVPTLLVQDVETRRASGTPLHAAAFAFADVTHVLLAGIREKSYVSRAQEMRLSFSWSFS